MASRELYIKMHLRDDCRDQTTFADSIILTER